MPVEYFPGRGPVIVMSHQGTCFVFVFLDNLECVGESEVCLHIRWKSHVRNTDLGTRSHCRSVVLEKNLEKKEVKTTAVPSRRSFLEVLKQATEFLRVEDVSPFFPTSITSTLLYFHYYY